jgi:hypothetical protein
MGGENRVDDEIDSILEFEVTGIVAVIETIRSVDSLLLLNIGVNRITRRGRIQYPVLEKNVVHQKSIRSSSLSRTTVRSISVEAKPSLLDISPT